jgi:hypothetical protein
MYNASLSLFRMLLGDFELHDIRRANPLVKSFRSHNLSPLHTTVHYYRLTMCVILPQARRPARWPAPLRHLRRGAARRHLPTMAGHLSGFCMFQNSF